MNTNEFIKRANKIHNYKYDYSKTVYTKSKENVVIICPKHGEFKQTADSHLHNHGCKLCAIEGQHNKQRKKLDEFIAKAKIVHSNKYDYSKVEYVNNHTNICIVCPIHGEFTQSPKDHLRGKGCRKCSYENRGLKHRLTNEEFISKSKAVHKGKYDYSITHYNGYEKDVEIICPIHGNFRQNADSHLQGHGCQVCNSSKLEFEMKEELEKNNIDHISQCNYKRLHWLNKQTLDFYIPSKNIAIECQGKQHFEVVDFSGRNKERALKEFNDTKERDERKKHLCEENGVRLLYFTKKKFLKSGNNVIDGEYFFNPQDIHKLLNE